MRVAKSYEFFICWLQGPFFSLRLFPSVDPRPTDRPLHCTAHRTHSLSSLSLLHERSRVTLASQPSFPQSFVHYLSFSQSLPEGLPGMVDGRSEHHTISHTVARSLRGRAGAITSLLAASGLSLSGFPLVECRPVLMCCGRAGQTVEGRGTRGQLPPAS